MKTGRLQMVLALFMVAALGGACGGSGGAPAGGGAGLVTVACTTLEAGVEHAVRSFPGESPEELEATVFLVQADGARLMPLVDPDANMITVTDGSVDVTCPVKGANETLIPANQVASIQLYQD